jgi:hypothetical protein
MIYVRFGRVAERKKGKDCAASSRSDWLLSTPKTVSKLTECRFPGRRAERENRAICFPVGYCRRIGLTAECSRAKNLGNALRDCGEDTWNNCGFQGWPVIHE